MDKLGVERRLLTAGAQQGHARPVLAAERGRRPLPLAMIDQIHQQFIEVVRRAAASA
jgi:protease-4